MRLQVAGGTAGQGRIEYVRFDAVAPNRYGRYPGVFALVNGLALDKRLTREEELFRHANNTWFEANLSDPGKVDPLVYDKTQHPGATAWFKTSATHLIERVTGYLAILDAHRVRWARTRSDTPGRIIYDDPHQIVVVPRVAATNCSWPPI